MSKHLRFWLAVLLLVVLTATITLLIADELDKSDTKPKIIMGTKNFAENKLIAEIYAQALRDAGYPVEVKPDGNERQAFAKLKKGEINAYPEYTGTVLSSLINFANHNPSPGHVVIPPTDLTVFRVVEDAMRPQGITAELPTPFSNSNALAVSPRLANRYNLQRISDLKKVERNFVLYGPPECRRRSDCLVGLRRVYGLNFKNFVPVPINRRHEPVQIIPNAVAVVFTTDPQIDRNREVILQDNLRMFPPYNVTLLVRSQTAAVAGLEFRQVIENVNENLTDETVQEMNAAVELDGRSIKQVASDYLTRFRIIE